MQNASTINLSIIIVNWNTRDLTAQCLDSIYAMANDVSLQVVVVDNASNDGSAQMVRERFPGALVIENHVNVGFARANNQAIAKSSGEFVLLLNSDTLVQPYALKEIVAFMRSTPHAGIVGAYVVNPDGSPQRCFAKFPTLLSESIYAWGLDSGLSINQIRARNSHAFPTDWVLGAALTVRRDALAQVGLLDPDYFMYSEEIDLCYRVKRAGWDIFVLPAAHVVHLGGESTKQTAAVMKAYLFQSKVRYFRKHHGALAASAMRVVFATSILGRRVAHSVRGRAEASALWAEAWTRFVKETRPES